MVLYTDKLPEDCKECKFARYSVSQEMHICNISNLVIPHYGVINTREKSCPLKELTNAQLAVGWYQEGKKPLNESSRSFRESDTIGYLIDYEWEIKEESQFTYTDWKGARKAVKEGKKVTITDPLNNKICYLVFGRTYNGYGLVYEENDKLSYICDVQYDSTEWKVWS